MTNATEQQAQEEPSNLTVDEDTGKAISVDAVSSGPGVGLKDVGEEDSQAGDLTDGEQDHSASDGDNDEGEEEEEADEQEDDNKQGEGNRDAGKGSGEEEGSGNEEAGEDEREEGEKDHEAEEYDERDSTSARDNSEDEGQTDENASNNSNEPQNGLDNEITEIPEDADPQTVFVRVSYTFTPSLEEVEWSPHLLQFSRDTSMEDFKTELERYMIAKLRRQEPGLYRSMTQTVEFGYYYIFQPSLTSDDPVMRHAFEFEGGQFPRVSCVEDFFPDPGDLRPELTVKLEHWDQILMKDLPEGTPNPVASIEFRDSADFQYFRMGTIPSKVKEPANVTESASELPETLRRIKSLYLLSWKVPCHQDSITEKSLVLVKIPAWKLRQFLICDTKHSENVPLKEFPTPDIDFDDPGDKRSYSTLQSRFTRIYNDSSTRPNDFRKLDADRLFYCFHTYPPAGLSVAGLPDLTIITMRFVSHLSESNARTNTKFESHQSIHVEETDDYIYPQVRQRVMKALDEQRKARAFLRDLQDRNTSWDVQLWVLPQGRLEDQTYTLFRFHEENRLCDFLHQRHFGNEDFRLFMEVHLVPVIKKGEHMTTKRGRSISMKTQR